jgi:hypothetical protein
MSFYEQEIARKGRSSRTLREEKVLPPLPRKKKISSKRRKRKTVARPRQYMSEFGHMVHPLQEEVVRSEDQNDPSLRMTGPQVIEALGGPTASFSGITRRQAREIEPGVQLREKHVDSSLDMTSVKHPLFDVDARKDWRIPEKFREKISALGGDPTIFRRCPIWMWDMYPDAHNDDGQLFELYQIAFLHYFEESSTGVEVTEEDEQSPFPMIMENFFNRASDPWTTLSCPDDTKSSDSNFTILW